MAIYYLESLPHGIRQNGEKLNTRTHAEYITRQGAYEKIRDREEDFVYRAFGNMPAWAKNDLDFWEAAEEHRRKNGRAYREIRLGLQEEFSLEENIHTIEKFLEDAGIKENHAYTYAIHDKTAMFSDEHRNVHAHIMFNERLIEKNRSLSKNEYFKRYTIQSDGKVTGGYKTSTYFSDYGSNGHLNELREMWADIVNEKFEEKGLEIRVSEKTLVEQREVLLEEGKFEEAELLDREPAHHLGDRAKNPKTRETIRELIRVVDSVYTATNDETEDSVSDDSKQQQELEETIKKANESKQLELAIFAYDAVIRKTAKELQKERQALRAKQALENEMDMQNREAKAEAFEIENNPMVITVGDVLKRIDEKMEMEALKANEASEKLNTVTPLIKSQKELNKMSFDMVTNGEYSKLHKAYLDQYKEVRLLKHAFNTTKANNFEEYKQRLHTLEEATQKKETIAKACHALHKNLRTTQRFAKARYMQALRTDNNQRIELANTLKTSIQTHRKNHQFYYNKNKTLFDEQPDRVLFADKLPTEVSLYNKLNGEIPLRELDRLTTFKRLEMHGKSLKEQYVVIPNTKANNNGKTTVQAIKVGDETFHGKAPIYEVEIINAHTKQGIPYIKVNQVEKTDQMARLYEYREYKKSKTKEPKELKQTQTKAASPNRHATISNHVKKKTSSALKAIIDELSKQEATGKTDNLWYENESASEKTEFEQTEERIKRGWSL